MAGEFDCSADFTDMVAMCGFPVSSVTVLKVDPDTGNTTANSTGVRAIGRTTNAETVTLSDSGEVVPKGRRWFLMAADISWGLRTRDQIQSGNATYEINDSVSLIGQDAVYRVESHYIGNAT
jgi:hypothetical protein